MNEQIVLPQQPRTIQWTPDASYFSISSYWHLPDVNSKFEIGELSMVVMEKGDFSG